MLQAPSKSKTSWVPSTLRNFARVYGVTPEGLPKDT